MRRLEPVQRKADSYSNVGTAVGIFTLLLGCGGEMDGGEAHPPALGASNAAAGSVNTGEGGATAGLPGSGGYKPGFIAEIGGGSDSIDNAQGGTTAAATLSPSGGSISTSDSTSISALGGAAGSGNSTGGAAMRCGSDLDLVAIAIESARNDWSWGDPALVNDKPCGIAGPIYAYSDRGVDGIAGTSDDTVQSPEREIRSSDVEDFLNPCAGGKCCISGETHLWPRSGTTIDYHADAWGGGIGLSLGKTDAAGARLPYRGPVVGFEISLSGKLEGQFVRIAYTQKPNDDEAPYFEVYSLDTFAVPFTIVTCGSWASNCTGATVTPYDLQVQIVGGDVQGKFRLCLDRVVPLFGMP